MKTIRLNLTSPTVRKDLRQAMSKSPKRRLDNIVLEEGAVAATEEAANEEEGFDNLFKLGNHQK